MDSQTVQNRLRLAILLTSGVFGVEAIGGALANSLALISDAAHMLTDVFSLLLTWFALKIAAQPSTSTKTYGYHRMEILAALVNGLLLVFMAIVIGWEAWERFREPPVVNSAMVLVVASIGLATNLGVIYFLKDSVGHHHLDDLNIKGAFYHVLGDTLASVSVIVGALVMWRTGWYMLDAVIAGLVALILLWGARNILSDSIHILLEGVPSGISIQDVEKELMAIPEVKDVHELHIWSICSNIYALSTHALVNDQKVNQAESILEDIKSVLRDKFNITHSTIQFESTPCQGADALCDMKH